jgi:hypothetical protein
LVGISEVSNQRRIHANQTVFRNTDAFSRTAEVVLPLIADWSHFSVRFQSAVPVR